MSAMSRSARQGVGVASRLAVLALGLVLLAGCSGAAAPGDTGSQTQPTAETGGGGGAATAPDPCTLLTAADVTSAYGKAGVSATYQPGTVVPALPGMTCQIAPAPGAPGISIGLEVCTLALCNFDTVKTFMGGATVSGVGDDAFWAAGCDGPDLVPNHQLWAKAKGLNFELTSACHTAGSLAADKSDQTLIDLMTLAISRSGAPQRGQARRSPRRGGRRRVRRGGVGRTAVVFREQPVQAASGLDQQLAGLAGGGRAAHLRQLERGGHHLVQQVTELDGVGTAAEGPWSAAAAARGRVGRGAACLGQLEDPPAVPLGSPHEPFVLQLLERGIDRAGARPPAAVAPSFELRDHLVAVHRLLGQEAEDRAAHVTALGPQAARHRHAAEPASTRAEGVRSATGAVMGPRVCTRLAVAAMGSPRAVPLARVKVVGMGGAARIVH